MRGDEREERRGIGTLDLERARLDFDLDVLYDAHPHGMAWHGVDLKP